MTSCVEIKALARDREDLLRKAGQLANVDGPHFMEQHDVVFDAKHGKLKIRTITEAGKGRSELIWHDRPNSNGSQTLDFTRTIIPHDVLPGLMETLAASMGQLGESKKSRVLFQHEHMRIFVDTIPEIGDVVELEINLTNERSADDAVRLASDVMDRLGVRQEDLLSSAFVDQDAKS